MTEKKWRLAYIGGKGGGGGGGGGGNRNIFWFTGLKVDGPISVGA